MRHNLTCDRIPEPYRTAIAKVNRATGGAMRDLLKAAAGREITAALAVEHEMSKDISIDSRIAYLTRIEKALAATGARLDLAPIAVRLAEIRKLRSESLASARPERPAFDQLAAGDNWPLPYKVVWSRWVAHLTADPRAALLARAQGKAQDKRLKKLSRQTMLARRMAANAWFDWQVSADSGATPTPESAALWVEALLSRECSPSTIYDYMTRLRLVFEAFEPDADLGFLAKGGEVFAEAAAENPPVIVPPEAEDVLAKAWGLIEAAREIRAGKREGALSDAARMFRDGLLSLFLSYMPVRRETASHLEVDRHVNLELGRIYIPAAFMKEENAESYRLAPELVAVAREFRNEWRPMLCADDTGFMFPGRTIGTPLTPCRLAEIIDEVLGVSPHKLRHMAATLYLSMFPDDRRGGSRILQQVSSHMVNRYSKTAKSEVASRKSREVQREVRDDLRRRRLGSKSKEGRKRLARLGLS